LSEAKTLDSTTAGGAAKVSKGEVSPFTASAGHKSQKEFCNNMDTYGQAILQEFCYTQRIRLCYDLAKSKQERHGSLKQRGMIVWEVIGLGHSGGRLRVGHRHSKSFSRFPGRRANPGSLARSRLVSL